MAQHSFSTVDPRACKKLEWTFWFLEWFLELPCWFQSITGLDGAGQGEEFRAVTCPVNVYGHEQKW